MIQVLAQLVFVIFLILLAGVAKRALEWQAYKKMGEEFERQEALRWEQKVGIPYNPNKRD